MFDPNIDIRISTQLLCDGGCNHAAATSPSLTPQVPNTKGALHTLYNWHTGLWHTRCTGYCTIGSVTLWHPKYPIQKELYTHCTIDTLVLATCTMGCVTLWHCDTPSPQYKRSFACTVLFNKTMHSVQTPVQYMLFSVCTLIAHFLGCVASPSPQYKSVTCSKHMWLMPALFLFDQVPWLIKELHHGFSKQWTRSTAFSHCFNWTKFEYMLCRTAGSSQISVHPSL